MHTDPSGEAIAIGTVILVGGGILIAGIVIAAMTPNSPNLGPIHINIPRPDWAECLYIMDDVWDVGVAAKDFVIDNVLFPRSTAPIEPPEPFSLLPYPLQGERFPTIMEGPELTPDELFVLIFPSAAPEQPIVTPDFGDGFEWPTVMAVTIGPRKQLRENFKNLGYNVHPLQQAHHLIPWAYVDLPIIKHAEVGGWNHNSPTMNGKLIGTNETWAKDHDTIYHNGSHPNYSKWIEVSLFRLQGLMDKGLTHKDARVGLEIIANEARKLISGMKSGERLD